MVTTVVSTMGSRNTITALMTWRAGSQWPSMLGAFQKKRMPTKARNTPRNWLPVSPMNMRLGFQLKNRKPVSAAMVPMMSTMYDAHGGPIIQHGHEAGDRMPMAMDTGGDAVHVVEHVDGVHHAHHPEAG